MRTRYTEDGALETLVYDYDESQWPDVAALRLQLQAVRHRLQVLESC